MSQIVVMPKLGFNQDEGVLVKWYKKEGEAVKKGEALFAIETDKTTMDIEATGAGVVRKLLCEEGETVPVTVPIMIVAGADEDISALLAEATGSIGVEGVEALEPEPQPEPEPKEQAEPAKPSAPRLKELADPATIQRLTGESVYKELMKDPAYAACMQKKEEEKATGGKPVIIAASSGRRISPRARRLAMEMGLDLDRLTAEVCGTGYEGGICEADVKAYATANRAAPAARPPASAPPAVTGPQDAGALEEIPYSGVRKIIGERLAYSKSTAPHVYFTQKVDMQALLELRKTINANRDVKTSVTDYVARAAIIALQKYPQVNASLAGDKIIIYGSINLGIAVAAPGGLIVPVVKEAQNLSMSQLSAETAMLVARAREGGLLPHEYSGGTFTISNLGMFGVDNFSAVINPPEAAILAVSATKDEAVVVTGDDGNKSVGIRPMMNIQLSADHRVIDGMLAAQFTYEIKELLESPFSLLF